MRAVHRLRPHLDEIGRWRRCPRTNACASWRNCRDRLAALACAPEAPTRLRITPCAAFLLWFLLVLLGGRSAAAGAAARCRHIAGFETGDFASLAYKIALLIFIGGAVLAMFRNRIAQAFEAALFWVVIGLVLAVGYTYRHDLRDVGDRVLAELMPGRAASARRTVEIARGRGGEFQVATQINGARMPMVLDTGASAVVLTQEAAKAAGLPLEVPRLQRSTSTPPTDARARPR